MDVYEKRGYLTDGFRLFHLTDIPAQEFEFHYHDFDKLIIFLSGQVTYLLEGRSYDLKPYDLVLVPHHLIHRPEIDQSVPYDRIIIYLSPDFLTRYQTADYDLSACIKKTRETHSEVLRIPRLSQSTLFQSIKNLETACGEEGFANELRCQLLFLEFMIQLNRSILSQDIIYLDTDSTNQQIQQILTYLNEHLTDKLEIRTLSEQFHISRYHMMRLFKQETGYTIGDYLTSKRLMLARKLLSEDYPITELCYACGFSSYAAFSRAYRAAYNEPPRAARTVGKAQSLHF